MRVTKLDERFRLPLYTKREAALFLGVPETTFNHWTGEVVTSVEEPRGAYRVPFVGLAEGLIVRSFRRTGVSMHKIKRALRVLAHEMGLDHALASQKLYADGARILYDYASDGDEELSKLTVVENKQGVFAPVIKQHLELITYEAGWASRLLLPITDRPILEVDPRVAFGQPVFRKGGARMKDVLDRIGAGESIRAVAKDFGVSPSDVEDVCDAVRRTAA